MHQVSAARAHNQQKCGLAAQMIDERRAVHRSCAMHGLWAACRGESARAAVIQRRYCRSSWSQVIVTNGPLCALLHPCGSPRCLALVGRRPRQQAMRRSSQLVRATKQWRRSRRVTESTRVTCIYEYSGNMHSLASQYSKVLSKGLCPEHSASRPARSTPPACNSSSTRDTVAHSQLPTSRSDDQA